MTSMMIPRWLLVVPLLATILPLTACSEVKDQLGLTRRTPDEFAVISRAPLQIPPQLDGQLPLPQPGMQRPQEVSPGDAAQAALLSERVLTTDSQSSAENALLQRAGAADANPNIRALVNKETAEGTKDTRPVVKRILSIVDTKDQGAASVLDARGELQRLKDNKQTGQPVTQGNTPTLDD
jgi:hypothetical protein